MYLGDFENVWNSCWNVATPPRFKVFIWRACRGIFPSKEALLNRGIDLLPLFSFCQNEDESILHDIVTCPDVQAFWFVSNFPFVTEYDEDLCFLGWFSLAITFWDKEQLLLFVIMAYKL